MIRRLIKSSLIFALLMVLVIPAGCYRGRPSKKPPIHIIPDMDSQPRYDTQEKNDFFPDHLAMRHPVSGTIAVGDLETNPEYYTGKDARGRLVEDNPVAINMPFLKRGQERFNIYCSPCHSRGGDGKGIMTTRGYVPPPSFHIDRLREVEDGHIFDVITNGLRNMPSYGHQVSVNDRWAIVAYVRALQRSQNATIEDVPEEKRDQLTKN